MNANPEIDATLRRHSSVAVDRAVLHFDGAMHGIDHASELDQNAVAGTLLDAAMMHGDGRGDQIAPKRP
jgi:hypothetical protein